MERKEKKKIRNEKEKEKRKEKYAEPVIMDNAREQGEFIWVESVHLSMPRPSKIDLASVALSK
jgi:hypothetical protein